MSFTRFHEEYGRHVSCLSQFLSKVGTHLDKSVKSDHGWIHATARNSSDSDDFGVRNYRYCTRYFLILDAARASHFARLALTCARQEYPNKPNQMDC